MFKDLMHRFLGLFAGGKKKKEVKGKGKNEKKEASRPGQAASKLSTTKSRRVGDQPKRSPINVLTNMKDLPAYSSLLTDEGGEFELSAGMRDHIILVKVKGARQDVILIATKEYYGKVHVHALRSRAIAKGYRVSIRLADKAVIRMVHDESRSELSSEAIEESVSAYQREFNELLFKAHKQNVSDIHIEVRRSEAKVRFRVNGNLNEFTSWSVKYAQEMGQVIYGVVAEEKDVTFNPDRPQDAVIDQEVDGMRIRVRLATMPAYPDGFDMVMRLLPMGVGGEAVPLDKLGYSSTQVQSIGIALSKPVGVTVIAGTTGSGKSTSLKNMLLSKITAYRGMIKVITVEDPPEYAIAGATQCPVVRSKTAKDGVNPFAAAIRAAMRSDPDVLMIGEVRDEDSGELLVHAVQSGHQVFTTVHASSAIGIVARLVGMGIGRDVIGGADFLSGLVYQTLLPVLCDNCSVPIDKHQEVVDCALMARISLVCDLSSDNIRFRGKGCKTCGDTGVVGRKVAAEVIVPDHQIMKAIREGNDTDAWQHWRQHGGKTALQAGLVYMRGGAVDPVDIEHKLGLLTSDQIMDDGVFNLDEEVSLLGGAELAIADEDSLEGVSEPGDDLPDAADLVLDGGATK